MFKRRAPHKRSGSPSTTATATAPNAPAPPHTNVDPPLASPLQMTFDFERPIRPSVDSFSRPRTSDGLASMFPIGLKTSQVSLQPPMLPPIPRVASREESPRSSSSNASRDGKSKMDGEADIASTLSQTSIFKPSATLERPFSLSRPVSSVNLANRPSTAGDISPSTPPRMDSSLFPKVESSSIRLFPPEEPTMSRAFIDSRDKPYSYVPPRMSPLSGQNASIGSSPDSPSAVNFSTRNPSVGSRTGQAPLLHDPNQPPSSPMASNFNNSLRRPSTQSSVPTPVSASPVITIGTPYADTTATHPLPQHVATRPKTAGSSSKMAGVAIPTHHTFAPRPDSKAEKKKTRLLNPIFLLQRRKSAQDGPAAAEEANERAAQAQALAQQSRVVATGGAQLPADFDPRIKGKVVHDFSAPRANRNTFYDSATASPIQAIQSANSTPVLPTQDASHFRQWSFQSMTSDSSPRRSQHMPVFKEHLNEHPEASRRVSSLQAETLENRDFLKRASKHSFMTNLSQESSVLPPFARRSQHFDPNQTVFYADDESNRSSDPSSGRGRDSNLSSTSQVSPVTARSSSQNVDYHRSMSPISPSSPGKTMQTASEQSNASPSQERHRKTQSQSTARPLSISIPPSSVDTIEESPSDASPAESEARQLVVPLSLSVMEENEESASVTRQISDPSIRPPSRLPPAVPPMPPMPDLVPETQLRDNHAPSKTHSSTAKLAEKRASAAGHSKKGSSVPPKHQASNASRFSFQMGESTQEEQALEEKHRRIVSKSFEATPSLPNGEEDDDDEYFDEDAMNDMDEMEVQAQHDQSRPPEETNPPPQAPMSLSDARLMLREPESDEESESQAGDGAPNPEDERNLPYPDHPAFRTHYALANISRNNSIVPGAPSLGGAPSEAGDWRDNTIDLYMRDSFSSGSQSRSHSIASGLTVNTHVTPTSPVPELGRNGSAAKEGFPGGAGVAKPRSSFYLQPHAAGYSPAAAPVDKMPRLATDTISGKTGSLLPGNPTAAAEQRHLNGTESNRIASGSSFPTMSDESVSPTTIPLLGDNVDGLFERASDSTRKSTPLGQNNSDASKHSRLTSSDSRTTPSPGPQIESVAVESLDGAQEKSNGSLEGVTPGYPQSPSSGPSTDNAFRVQDVGFTRLSNPASPASKRNRADRHSIATQARSGGSDDGRQRGGSTSSTTSSRPMSAGYGLGMNMFGSGQRSPRSLRTASGQFGSNNTFSAFNFEDEPSALSPTRDNFSLRRYSSPRTPRAHNPFVHQRVFSQSSTIDGSIRGASPVFELGPVSEEGADTPVGQWEDFDRPQGGRRGIHGEALAPVNSPSGRPQSTQSDAFDQRLDNGIPMHHGGVRSGLPTAGNQLQHNFDGPKPDDLYYDDGNFDQDLATAPRGRMDENDFDNDSFLQRRPAGFGNSRGAHSRNITATSLGSEGPYPSFAMPNAARARERDSQLMLEDLILQGPVDPKLIPQRNPSEDAKRLGLSNKVPPLPVVSDSADAHARMHNNLQSYHAALADAANKAAADGRFVRAPSQASTVARQISVASKHSVADDASMYSDNEEGGELAMPDYGVEEEQFRDSAQSGSFLPAPPSAHTSYILPKMGFDFGFDEPPTDDGDGDDVDDDIVAAANAEVLASDDDGFYGQEFHFYGRPRANSNDLEPVNGGYFGADGDDGLARNKGLQEPNLTPITERSEFSTRNSFIGLGVGATYGSASAGGYNMHSPALARMPVTPLMEKEITSFEDLRKLRANAFGGSSASLDSNSNRSSSHSLPAGHSPSVSTKFAGAGYFGPGMSGSPMTYGYSTESSNSSNPPSAHALLSGHMFQDTPQSASSGHLPFGVSDATPRKSVLLTPAEPPSTVRKASVPLPATASSSSSSSLGIMPPDAGMLRKSWGPALQRAPLNGQQPQPALDEVGPEFVSYVQECDPDAPNKVRWIKERRRTSEQGQLELIGRELVKGGWI